VGAVSGFSVEAFFLLDFLDLALGDSLAFSVIVDSLAGEASVFLELLFFSLVLLLFGLEALSGAGLLVVFDDLAEAEGEAVIAG
jgi:hypothetical protein